jgi:hypothetical protein
MLGLSVLPSSLEAMIHRLVETRRRAYLAKVGACLHFSAELLHRVTSIVRLGRNLESGEELR